MCMYLIIDALHCIALVCKYVFNRPGFELTPRTFTRASEQMPLTRHRFNKKSLLFVLIWQAHWHAPSAAGAQRFLVIDVLN